MHTGDQYKKYKNNCQGQKPVVFANLAWYNGLYNYVC